MMNKEIKVLQNGEERTFNFYFLLDYQDYDLFCLPNDVDYAVADIRVLEDDDGEYVESIILVCDNGKGIVVFIPVDENIEFIEETLKDRRVQFVCDREDIEAFNRQFGFALQPESFVYEQAESADLVEYYRLESGDEINLLTPDVEEKEDDFSEFLNGFWEEVSDAISGIYYIEYGESPVVHSVPFEEIKDNLEYKLE